jgi:hypothetical protein
LSTPDRAEAMKAKVLWDQAVQGKDGRPAKPESVDNVNGLGRPTGNSSEEGRCANLHFCCRETAGLRRLRKAVEDRVDPETGEVIAADEHAKALFAAVLAGDKSVRRARPRVVLCEHHLDRRQGHGHGTA